MKPKKPMKTPPTMRRVSKSGKHQSPIKRAPPQGPTVVGDSLASIGYQESTAVRYLFYSYAAYCDAGSITDWSCTNWCSGDDYTLSDITTFSDSNTNTFGYVGYNAAHNEIVVSYRGTEATSIQDWIDDLTFDKTALQFMGVDGAQVHSGFYNCYLALQAASQSAVQNLLSQYPDATVYFTGHSLGGAITTIATLDAADNWGLDSSQIGHISFGSPRVGDATFANVFTDMVGSDNHYRVVNDHDIVPHVPLEIQGFHHIPTEVWLHGDDATICNDSGEDPSCSDSLLLATSVYDHLHYYGYAQGPC